MLSVRLVLTAACCAALALAQSDDRCTAMKNARIAGVNLVITSATHVAAAEMDTPFFKGALPSYCRVDGEIEPRTGVAGVHYAIGFALGLPDDWNGRFLMQGGGGLNGFVQPPLGGTAAGDKPALARGFAVVGTDSGHKGKHGFDGSFFADQQATIDFSYNGIGRTAAVAKALIEAYYGKAPAHSYFTGCSTGGREGMVMTQRYPLYFDGVIVGAPAMRTGFSNLADRWVVTSFNQIAPLDAQGKPVTSAVFTDTDRKLIIDSLLNRCDALDGARDGMIFNVSGCDFDPATIQCKGEKTDACLSAKQVSALRRAFAGPVDSTGYHVYSGFAYDTGIAAKKGIPGLLNPGPSPVGPQAGVTQDVDREAREAQEPLIASAHYTNLSTFSGHGGKLLFFHGVSDPWFSALDTLAYYKRLASTNGGESKVAEWSRFYFVPGMGHCGGGEATLDNFDMLSAVVDWVEKGTAPASVPATGKAFPGRSRPLCAWPQHAHYTGQGDVNDARNWTCRE